MLKRSVKRGRLRSTRHHDIAIVDESGALKARARIDDSVDGLNELLQMLAEHGDTAEDPVPVAIETSHGLLVAALRATGRPVYAINPMAAARYRDRRTVARKKSDHLDALVLANILRTDADAHRQLPADSKLVQAVTVLARAQQNAVWDRTQAGNKLTSHLREYFPGFLAAVGHRREGIFHPIARVLLAAAPTPQQAAKLTRAQLRALLNKAGRKNTIDVETERLHTAPRTSQMRQLPLVKQAMGRQTLALLRQLDAACTSADDLAEATTEAFEEHPDAEIITSFPGLGPLSGARALAEIGDDRSRFADARGMKAYAGAAPITRASGRSTVVMARRVKNQRLAGIGYMWAFSAMAHSTGARAHYDRRREAGDRHTAAQRNLFSRMIGCLHHCLTRRTHFNEDIAFPAPREVQLSLAA
ncbi:IS110 family transposase [Streptomyces achromogenes]|uniref:IS110 family transposase n=1 Tax=Streptomyces achromogenes TaxID=67255 RepID=UPI0036F7E02D